MNHMKSEHVRFQCDGCKLLAELMEKNCNSYEKWIYIYKKFEKEIIGRTEIKEETETEANVEVKLTAKEKKKLKERKRKERKSIAAINSKTDTEI